MLSLVVYVYQAGWERVARDLGFLVSFLVGVLEKLGKGLEGFDNGTGNTGNARGGGSGNINGGVNGNGNGYQGGILNVQGPGRY